MWGENRIGYAVFGEQIEGLQIDGGFSQPHALRLAAKSVFEVDNSPNDLGLFVALVGQRHDQVVVDLGDGGAVAGVASRDSLRSASRIAR